MGKKSSLRLYFLVLISFSPSEWWGMLKIERTLDANL